MKFLSPTLLALALAAAFPAAAQSNEELLKELRALRERVTELEKKVQTQAAQPKPEWGMTPEQAAEFNRVVVKTEAMEDNFTNQGFKGLKLSGYIEPVFIYNQKQHRAGFQFLNQQSDGYFYDTSFMGAASLDITKETDSGVIWKLTLSPNRGVGAGIDGASIVQEATVSIPVDGPATRLVAGQIPDWSGYEYQQPTLNPFTTHNILYDFTLPFAYTGVGIDHKDGKWWLRGAIANVNSTIRQAGYRQPALVLRGDYAKGEYSGFGFAGLIGKTANFLTETSTMTQLFEVDGYFTRGDLTFQGQVSLGRQDKGAINTDADGNPQDSAWWGVSGLAGMMFTPRLQGLVRADYIHNTKNGGGLLGFNFADDRNGIGPNPNGDPNKGANRYALTFGLKYAFDTSTTVKLEYRLDGATEPVFIDTRSGNYSKTNNLLGASIVVAF